MSFKKNLIYLALKKKNFSDIIKFYSKNDPSRVIFICENKSLNYKQLDNKINQVCNLFKKYNIRKNSPISLYLKNSIEYIIFYFACIRYGAIVSPIPYGVDDNKIRYYLNLSRSILVISEKKIVKNIKNLEILNSNDFENKIKNFSTEFKNPKIKPKDICTYYFSSGTTSKPKLIKYSNYAMVSCQKILFKSNFLQKFSSHLCILPLGHTASLRYSIKNAIVGQGKVYIFKNFWQIKDNFWKLIKKHKINFVGVVPSILEAVNSIYKKQKKINHLKFIGCGSSILDKRLQIDFYKKFKIIIKNIYGMSEIGVATIDDPKKNNQFGTIGKSLKFVKLKLFDKQGKQIKNENVIGEICVKTPALFSGYKPHSKLTKKKTFFYNYFRTGDLGLLENNLIKFIDRSKDIIIKGGVNLSPQEIDDCIKKNSNVTESASVGVKDKFFGEVVRSYVVLKKNKKISEDKLIRYCHKTIGDFRSPSQIIFLTKLPKTPSGKIIKRNLRTQ